MAGIDRDELIELLDRLARESDEEVLDSARELNRLIRQSGRDWDDVLRAQAELAGTDAGTVDEEAPPPRKAGRGGAEASADGKLLERIAARDDVSADLRGELDLLRRDLAEGEFTADDRTYLQSLAKRLGVK